MAIDIIETLEGNYEMEIISEHDLSKNGPFTEVFFGKSGTFIMYGSGTSLDDVLNEFDYDDHEGVELFMLSFEKYSKTWVQRGTWEVPADSSSWGSFSDDGSVLGEGVVGGVVVHEALQKCTNDENLFRLSMALISDSDGSGWKVTDSREKEEMIMEGTTFAVCEHCYNDFSDSRDAAFQESLVLEETCILKESSQCVGVRFTSGSGRFKNRFAAFLVDERGSINEDRVSLLSYGTNKNPIANSKDECLMDGITCPTGFTRFAVNILTDSWPEENKWTLEDGVTGEIFVENRPYEKSEGNSFFFSEECVDASGCYRFTFFYEGKDGLDNDAYYEIVYGDSFRITGDVPDNKKIVTKSFGNC